MRTLKKTLALVLVIAMVFSLCAMSVSAVEDYKDDADIENKLAVYTLTEMGILNGMDGENFAPNGNFTRAQAAKIIAYMLGDGEKAAEKTATNFADVDKDYWASGYIAYCANLGIVEGYGDGNYYPEETLTGYQWLKMLICALGYNATVEGLNGIGWDVMTAIMAGELDLLTGIETLNKREVIAREDAAQAAFNALFALTMSYSAQDFIPGTTVGKPVYGPMLIATLGYGFSFDFAEDVYGRPEKAQWSVTDLTAVKPEAVVVYEEATDYVEYTAAKKFDDLKKALGEKALITETCADSENGDILRVYDLNEYFVYAGTGYEFYLVETKVATLAEKDIVAEGYNVKAGIIINGKKFETTDEFVAGDIVLYTMNKDGSKIATAYAADAFVADITSIENITKTNNFFVDGVEKELHGEALTTIAEVIKLYADEEEQLFFVDEYGYVVLITEVPEYVPVWYYGYMTDYETQNGVAASGNDLIPNSTAVATLEKFEIVTTTGETVVYDGAFEVNVDGTLKGDFVGKNKVTVDGHGLVYYALDEDGKICDIILDATAGSHGFVTGEGTLRDGGHTGTPLKSALFDSKTVAFVWSQNAKTGDITAKVYTGYLNIPTFDGYTGRFVDASVKGVENIEAIAVKDTALYVAPVTEYVYVTSTVYDQTYTGTGANRVYINTYEGAYVDGSVDADALVTASTANADPIIASLGYDGVGLYLVTYDKDGYVESMVKQPAVAEVVFMVEETYFKTTDQQGANVHYVDDATAYYQITETKVTGKPSVWSVAKVDGIPEVAYNQAVVVWYTKADLLGNEDFVYFTVVEILGAKAEAVEYVMASGWTDAQKAVAKAAIEAAAEGLTYAQYQDIAVKAVQAYNAEHTYDWMVELAAKRAEALDGKTLTVVMDSDDTLADLTDKVVSAAITVVNADGDNATAGDIEVTWPTFSLDNALILNQSVENVKVTVSCYWETADAVVTVVIQK